MNQADRIMKRKAFIKAEMDKALPKKQSDELWLKAADRLAEILTRYSALPKGVHTHTDNFIFPSAAVYLTVKEAVGKESAYDIIEKAAVSNTLPMGKKLARLMKIPGMSRLFIKVWDPMTKKMFGPDNGFKMYSIRRRKANSVWTSSPAPIVGTLVSSAVRN